MIQVRTMESGAGNGGVTMKAQDRLLPLLLFGLAGYGMPAGASDDQPGAEAPGAATGVPDSMLQAARTPDSKGSGPYPAMKSQVNDSSPFVVYRPADLTALGRRKMPIYVFGNGA